MDLQEFSNEICDYLEEALGPAYTAECREMTKNNGVMLHGVIVHREGSNVAPTIYMDGLFQAYEDGRDFTELAEEILTTYRRSAREIRVDMEYFTHYPCVKNRILYKLIHRESNRELLSTVPFVPWQDLALVFYYIMEDERFGHASILVQNSHMEIWGVDTQTLFAQAKKNMRRMKPVQIQPVQAVIQEIMGDVTVNSVKAMSDSGDVMEPNPPLYVMSTKDRLFGAAALLDEKPLRDFAEAMHRDLLILPSSVHEVLLVPTEDAADIAFFADMVREVNDTQVDPEERLSYSVYYYDRNLQEIRIA